VYLSFPAVPDARDKIGSVAFKVAAFLRVSDQNQLILKRIRTIHYLTMVKSQRKTSL